MALGVLLATSFALSACGADTAASTSTASDAPTVNQPVVSPPPAAALSNSIPTITGSPGTTATVGTAYTFQPTASDADADTLTFSAQGLPSWLALDATSGRASGTPGDTDAGQTADIVISVTDGKATTALAPFQIQIAARVTSPTASTGNAPPTISGSPGTTATAGSNYSFTPAASDVDSSTLTYSVTGKPVWASFSSATGALRGTPARAQVGSYTGIVIRVTDGTTTVSLPAFSIQVVAPPNTAPTISGVPCSVPVAQLKLAHAGLPVTENVSVDESASLAAGVKL